MVEFLNLVNIYRFCKLFLTKLEITLKQALECEL